MVIDIFGVEWNLIVVTVYLFSTFVFTEFFKKKISIHPVLISWIIGGILFTFFSVFHLTKIEFNDIIQYVFITIVLNGSYKIYTSYLRRKLEE